MNAHLKTDLRNLSSTACFMQDPHGDHSPNRAHGSKPSQSFVSFIGYYGVKRTKDGTNRQKSRTNRSKMRFKPDS